MSAGTIRKRCKCGAKAWGRCEHPWTFQFEVTRNVDAGKMILEAHIAEVPSPELVRDPKLQISPLYDCAISRGKQSR